MLDEDEWAEVESELTTGVRMVQEHCETHSVSLRETPTESFFSRALGVYERITGVREPNPNALWHHRVAQYGPPCHRCGKPLRTPNARAVWVMYGPATGGLTTGISRRGAHDAMRRGRLHAKLDGRFVFEDVIGGAVFVRIQPETRKALFGDQQRCWIPANNMAVQLGPVDQFGRVNLSEVMKAKEFPGHGLPLFVRVGVSFASPKVERARICPFVVSGTNEPMLQLDCWGIRSLAVESRTND